MMLLAVELQVWALVHKGTEPSQREAFVSIAKYNEECHEGQTNGLIDTAFPLRPQEDHLRNAIHIFYSVKQKISVC